jgi:glycosyltransferase involved in cell wall biosynthesis
MKSGLPESSHPLVSVIIPTHNRQQLLRRALMSVARQTYEPIEVVVVNDGSSDDTDAVVAEFQQAHPRIKYLQHSRPMGAPKARNYGIRESTGDFLTFLDDDDELLPDNILSCMAAYDDKYAYICTGYTRITRKRHADILPKAIITYDAMLYKIVTGNQVVVKRERVLELGGFDEELLSSQDYDMWLRLNENYGDAKCIRKPLTIMHTEHEHARITSSANKIKGAFCFYNKHKRHMDRSQRKYQLFYIHKLKRKKIGLRQFLSCVPAKYYWPDIKYYFLVNFPRLRKSRKSA